ncbi:MAG: hypothetical protein L3J76_03640 [Candidatus Hydrothermae bacterium]|nr:hypothetical protein [Candidatus Hydrothermae bacterium]
MWWDGFKTTLRNTVDTLLWRQWSAMGIAVTEEPLERWVLDPEALWVTTHFLSLVGHLDLRLADVSRVWWHERQHLLSIPRIKRMLQRTAEMLERVHAHREARLLLDQGLHLPGPSQANRGGKVLLKTSFLFPPLLRFRLRHLFGSAAHGEVCLYFLYHPRGSTYAIAREMFLHQKTVHTVVAAWERSGLLSRDQGKARGYWMRDTTRMRWIRLLDLSTLPRYLNWGRLLGALSVLLWTLEHDPWASDEYLSSRAIRDLLPELWELWRATRTSPLDPTVYPGESLLPAFATSFQKVIKGILSTRGERTSAIVHSPSSFSKRDMQPNAKQALKRRYPPAQGWKFVSPDENDPDRPDFVLERKDFWGTWKRVVAIVTADCVIDRAHVRRLQAFARKLAGQHAQIEAKLLIVPAGADTSVVPKDIRVVYLRGFKCKG